MIPIDKGIPIPTKAVKPRFKYPWLYMEIGDSFATDTTMRSMLVQASQMGKRYNATFTVRQQSSTTVRVWRIK